MSGYTLNYGTNGSGAPSTNRILNVNGTISVTHDAAGNLTQEGSTTYSFDAASRLKEVGSGGQNVYGYDGDGRRVRQVANGGAPLHYVWSSVLGEVAYEAIAEDSAVRAYLYYGGNQIALRGSDRGFYWVHPDHLGNLKKLTRTNGTVAYRVEYDPHGQRVMEWSDVSTNLDSHKFTGHEYDTVTGLEYAKARMLSHNRGRFMKPDPLGSGASNFSRPQTLNLYSYVNNDPINFIDRGGLIATGVECGFLGHPGSERPPWLTWECTSYGEFVPEPWLSPDPTPPESSPSPTKDDLIAALRGLPEGCVRAFGGQDTINKRIDEIAKGEITFIDLRTQGGLSIPYDPRWRRTYQQFFDQARREDEPAAMVLHIRGPLYDKTIMFGDRFFNGPGAWFWADDHAEGWGISTLAKFQAVTLVHEYLHILNNMSDSQLYQHLKSQGNLLLSNDVRLGGESAAITAWISKGCPRQ